MSFEAMAWARKTTAPNSGAKFMLLMLAAYAGKKGESYYTMSEIAEDCQISVDSVRRRLIELESGGFIARIERRRADGSRSSDYIVLLVGPEERAYAESLGWRVAETPGIPPLADCDHPPADCDHLLAPAPGGGRNGATPIMNHHLTDTEPSPTPAPRGVCEVASLRDEAEAAEARWEAMKSIWPFNPKASPGKARAAFFALSVEEREQAIRFAPRYLAATKGGMQRHLCNWLADRDWTGFVEQEAKAEREKQVVALARIEQDARELAKFGGVVIYIDGRRDLGPHAAWRRHDVAIGIDYRREVGSYPLGQGYLRPARFPPGKTEADRARVGSVEPEERAASP